MTDGMQVKSMRIRITRPRNGTKADAKLHIETEKIKRCREKKETTGRGNKDNQIG